MARWRSTFRLSLTFTGYRLYEHVRPRPRTCDRSNGAAEMSPMSDPDEAEQTFPASDSIAYWAGENPKDVLGRTPGLTKMAGEPRIDPQDRQFGAAAARDQERVDQLEEAGVDEASMPDESAARPRAGGKADPPP